MHLPRRRAAGRLVGQWAMMDRCTTVRKIDFGTEKKGLEPAYQWELWCISWPQKTGWWFHIYIYNIKWWGKTKMKVKIVIYKQTFTKRGHPSTYWYDFLEFQTKKLHHSVRIFVILRTFQQTPGAYPKPPGPTVYDSEFLNRLGVKRGCLGYAKQGYVGFPLELWMAAYSRKQIMPLSFGTSSSPKIQQVKTDVGIWFSWHRWLLSLCYLQIFVFFDTFN